MVLLDFFSFFCASSLSGLFFLVPFSCCGFLHKPRDLLLSGYKVKVTQLCPTL